MEPPSSPRATANFVTWQGEVHVLSGKTVRLVIEEVEVFRTGQEASGAKPTGSRVVHTDIIPL